MSAAEIIEQIKALSPDEQRQVSEFIRGMDHDDEGRQSDIRYAEKPTFESAVERVFEKHDELFRKLAQ